MARPSSIIPVALLLTFAASKLSADATFTHHWTFDGTLNDSIGTQPLAVGNAPAYVAGLLGQGLQSKWRSQHFCAYFKRHCSWLRWVLHPLVLVQIYGGATQWQRLCVWTLSKRSRPRIYSDSGLKFDYFNEDTLWNSGVDFLDGAWHNVIASYDGTNHIVYGYLDGKFLGTDNRALMFHDATPLWLRVGSREESCGCDTVHAIIDDVYFGTGVVTSQQVQNIWNGGKGGPPGGTGTIQVTTNSVGASFRVSAPATFTGSGLSNVISTAPPGDYTITWGPNCRSDLPMQQAQTLHVGAADHLQWNIFARPPRFSATPHV